MGPERPRILAVVIALALACVAQPALAVDAADAKDKGANAPVTAPGTLVDAPGKDLVAAHCGACHSLGLVTQNRGDADHWTKLIRWMQADHNLWDLGPAEDTIVEYLATHYGAPDLSPRRAPLDTRWRNDGD